MTTGAKLLTAEDLLAMPQDARRYELLDGVLVEMAPNNEMHDIVRGLLGRALINHVLPRQLGYVLVGDTGYILRRNPDRVRAPDVAFKALDRVPAGGLSAGFSDVIPDLIVEVVSPGDTAAEVQRKVDEWLAAGARLVWVVYPESRSVTAYQAPTVVRRYAAADTLDAEPVLPGFACPVAQLFP